MQLFGFSIILFAGALLTHIIAWRFLRPRRHIRGLLLHFASVWSLAVMLDILAVLPGAPGSLLSWLHASLFYWPAALAYVSLFSLIEQDSPSLLMVDLASGTGRDGVSRQDLLSALHVEGGVVLQRLRAACDNGLVAGNEALGWSLTPRGLWVARVSALAARLYRLDRAG